jgi:ABC-2 type transport system ATP-binding protein
MLGSLRGLADRGGTEVRAVSDVSFEIGSGEVVGYLGPNGAGKSTTIKMLTGILVPSTGTARVGGLVPWERRRDLARRIGVVFGQRTQLWWDLPLIDSFELLRHVYRVPADRHARMLAEMREVLELDAFLDTPVRQLSLGQRMRGDLAAAMLHEPDILYLDEPTIGLDVVAKARVREFLAGLNRERQVTVMLTTHDLADVEQLCSRLIIIDGGRMIFDGSLAEIRRRFGSFRTVVVDLAESPVDADADEWRAFLPDGAEVIRSDGPRVAIRFDSRLLTAAAVIGRVVTHRSVRDLALEEPEIEEIIRGIYERGAADPAA